jgi:acetoin utilization deacetylase AcuC-like enzyme
MLLFTHPCMLRHEVPAGHPEQPARLEAVLAGLENISLDRREAPLASRAMLARVHPAALIAAWDDTFARASEAPVAIDADTWISRGTRQAAYRAAGAAAAAVDAVLTGADNAAFCAVRPPGHHAEPMTPMGFCIFNNVAIGALHALEAHGLSKVAVVDFDVHHGNGTQAVAEGDARIFFASTHQSPLYPGTGGADEHGPAGNVVNAPLPPGADSATWRRAMERLVLPALDAFAPELILVSAGFDAHRADPLANMELEDTDFAWAGERLAEAALRHCKGRIVSTLEGGYDLNALARSAHAFVGALHRS